MSTIFLKILNMSLAAGWLILAVIVLRLLLKKAPKWVSCLLWALVAIRLLVPFSIESALSLIPSSEVVSTSIVSNEAPSVNTGFKIVNEAVNPVISTTFAPPVESSVTPMAVIVSIAAAAWIVGMIAMLVYALVSFLKLKKQVSASTPVNVKTFETNRTVMACDDIKSPFILGIFKPVIYIPSNLDLKTAQYVCAHENAHLRRRDNWWKPLGFALLSVHWFNPLVWIAYVLLCRDIEAACDEKVIKDKDRNYMADYSQALLDCAMERKRISACPVAFGETGVKGRVKGILNYKKPAFWIIIVALVITAVVAVCFLTNPKKKLLFADENVNTVKIEKNENYVLNPSELSNEGEEPYLQNFLTEGTGFTQSAEEDNQEAAEEIVNDYVPGDENFDIEYEYRDGLYVVDNGQSYKYKKILVGKNGSAACPGMFTVLTNNPDITFETVEKSLFSSNSADWLDDTQIIGMGALNRPFEGFNVWPTESERISAEFDDNHQLTDIAGETGDPVYAIADGIVIFAGFDSKKGNTLRICSNNAVIEYTHLDSIAAKEFSNVKAGDIIASLGNSGASTGPHLGISLTVNGEPADIKDYYK